MVTDHGADSSEARGNRHRAQPVIGVESPKLHRVDIHTASQSDQKSALAKALHLVPAQTGGDRLRERKDAVLGESDGG